MKPRDYDTSASHNVTLEIVELIVQKGPHAWGGRKIAFSSEPGHVCLYTTLEGP